MRAEARFRLQLIGALARDLPPGGMLFGVGLPGQDVVRLIAGLRPDLPVIEALSEPLLACHAGFVATLLAGAEIGCDAPGGPLLVGPRAAEGRVAPARGLGRFALAGPGAAGLRIRALPDLLAQLRRPGLLHLGAAPGHAALLAAALPVLAARGMPAWAELSPASDAGWLCELPAARDFALYGLLPGGGLTTLPRAPLPPLRGLLLAPRGAWMAYGLDRLAEVGAGVGAATEQAFRAPLLVPRRAGLDRRLLDRIAPGAALPPLPALAEERLLRPGREVFAEGARLERVDQGGAVLQPLGPPRLRLLALPPVAGRYRLALAFAGDPGMPPAGLTLRLQDRPLPLLPAGPPEGAFGLRDGGLLRVAAPLTLAGPMLLELELGGQALSGPPLRGLGLSLVEPFGLELNWVEPEGADCHLPDDGSGASRGEDDHGGGDADRAGGGRPADRLAAGGALGRAGDRRGVAAP